MAAGDQRHRFLKDAARLLAFAAPATSATLGAAHTKLLQERDLDLTASTKEWDALRREKCGACGNIMLPGWSCIVSHKYRTKKLAKGHRTEKTKKTERKDKDVVLSCLRCDRNTIQPLPMRPAKHIRKRGRDHKVEMPVITATGTGPGDKSKAMKSSNASSKQRAKARKGGLQAMLTQSKTQKAKPGLDLLDFMS